MFISYYTIITFWVNFFSNVYILVNTIFECSYLFFGWEIDHPQSMYVTRGMGRRGGGSSKMFTDAYSGRGVSRTHLHYLLPYFCLMLSCFICRNLSLLSFKKGAFVRIGYFSQMRFIPVVMKEAFFTLNCFSKPKFAKTVLILIK